MNFTTIEYLKKGNPTQQKAYKTLQKVKVFSYLRAYQPLLVGTIPLKINTLKSDLDIILYTTDVVALAEKIKHLFGQHKNFKLNIKDPMQHILVCTFVCDAFEIEIYSQNIPTRQQYGFLHLLKEYEILQIMPPSFKQKVIALKNLGIKTEPAFAQLLNLEGNPYQALLAYQHNKNITT